VTTDRNGNQITGDSSGHFYETLSSTAPALTVSGSGTPASPTKFTYTAPNGQPAAFQINYTQYTVATNFGIPGIVEYGSKSVPLATSVQLPDGSQYSFTYEQTPSIPTSGACTPLSGTYQSYCVTARIASITLPTGGQITYAYSDGSNGILSDGSTATLTRTTPDGIWKYSQVKNTGAASTTTIADPLSNETIVQFQGIYETQRLAYQGSHTSGTLLQTTNTCYNGAASPCTSTAITLPITQKTVIQQYGSSGLQSKRVYSYNTYGSLTEEDDYDYASGNPRVILRKYLITYASLNNSISSLPATVTTCSATGTSASCNGAGTPVAQTTYTYDQVTPVVPAGATPQHVAISGSRGSATTVSYLVQGSATISQTFAYYDTGTVKTATDSNGAVTTYNYPDATSTCGNAFPTSLSEPLSLSKSTTWNCAGGVLTQVTDENGKNTTTAYNDSFFWRPATVTDPTGTATNYYYATTAPFNTVESKMAFNSGNSVVDVLTTVDGLGRTHLQQKRQGPTATNYDSVETDYDSLGRLSRVTLPYPGTAGQACPPGPSCPSTTRTYDALSRDSQISDAGGGSRSYTYTQNDTYVNIGPPPTGESAKRRQVEHDALGRLTSVCEITAGTTAAPAGNCAQGASQTGYWTKYMYDALGDLTGVIQNAQSSSNQQTRSFSYDALGRLTSEANPEAGTTTYTYDSATGCSPASSGDPIKKIDAVGNVTCYAYDTLHRPTSITYSGPYATNTPNKYFVYDSASVNGVTMVNARNRLAEAYTTSSSCTSKCTDQGFSYSARGEVSDVYQSTPHSGGYYHINQTYWVHGVPSQLSQLAGLPAITYGGTIGSNAGLDGEGRVTQITAATGQNPVTGTSYNVSSLPVQVNFGSADSDIFAYDANTLRMTQYQLRVNGQSSIGALTWNANSTLQKLVITDPFNAADNQTCNYNYDDLTRLASANCGSVWSQTFSYDWFGNINKNGSMSFTPFYSSATNRMTSFPGGFTPTYDANGNVTNDSNHTYAWDADGNSTTVDAVGMTYDALDRIVEQNRSGSYTQIVYAPTGDKLALMVGQTLQKAFVPLPGQATAVYTSTGLSYYRHSDWLGSARLTSTSIAAAGTPGSGSATVSGSEQSLPGGAATSGSGSVSFSGSLQSKQIQTQAATPGNGSITISGSEQSKTTTYSCGPNGQTCTTVVYDTGTITVTVNGEAKSANWGANDSPATISANLASALTGGSYVNATASGGVVTLTAKTSGSTTNYSLSVSVVGTNNQFSQPSFSATRSGPALTGGADAVYATRYDSGSSTITVNGHADTVSWSGSSTTTSSVASGLASTINTDSAASVTASASGSTVSLTAKGTGASTNYSLSSSWTYDSAYFSSSSFTSTNSGGSLAGGSNGTAMIYDSGNVWVTVNGTQYSASYGQGSTANTVASAVANAVNAGSAPVTASASGATISLTANTTGANTNYSLASGSSTSQPSNFSQPSFTVSVSGSSLTGGTGGGTSMYADTAYAPFGEPYAQAGASDLSFTGQNQDTVGGDYDFLFREYSNQGRWPSPDPVGLTGVNPNDPQRWNRYAYLRNNPLSLVDPLGLDCIFYNAFDGISWGPGDCSNDIPNGVFVDGSVTDAWLDSNGDLHYAFSPANCPSGNICVGAGSETDFANWDWSTPVNVGNGGSDPTMQILSALVTTERTIDRTGDCYAKMHSSTAMKTVSFFSLLSYTPLNKNSRAAWVETGKYGTLKVVGLAVMQKLGEFMMNAESKGVQIIGTSLYGIASGVETAATAAGPILTGVATAIDTPVTAACGTLSYAQELGLGPE